MKKIAIKRKHLALLSAVITALIILSFSATIIASADFFAPFSSNDGKPVNRVEPSIEPAGSESDFQVKIAYAYVGPLPPEKAYYTDTKTNETMVHVSQYPSAVFLEFASVPSTIRSCDAVIAVYGVKIAADTGPTEYYGWSIGTNYTAISQESFFAMNTYPDELIHRSIYRVRGGSWSYNLTARPTIGQTIGSVGSYTMNSTFTRSSRSDLSVAGIPNAISVEVYRIGYVTMTNGSVTIYEDAVTDNKPVAYTQLSKYEGGFIFNNLLPAEQLKGIDLFHPQR